MSLEVTFTDILQAMMAAEGLSMRELAERSGVCKTLCLGIKNGSKTASLNAADRIATALGWRFRIEVEPLTAPAAPATPLPF